MSSFKKSVLLSCFVLFCFSFSHSLFAETTSFSYGQWEAIISRQVRYPIEALRARKEGTVAVALSTDSSGNLQDIKLDGEPLPIFGELVLNAVESSRDLWSSEMLGDREKGNTYFVVFNFVIVMEGNSEETRLKSAINYIQKGKPDKALKIADKLVKENPYSVKRLELRSQIHRQLGNEKQATDDLLAYQKIQNQTLSQIDIKAFRQVSTRSVSGALPNNR